MKSQKTKTRKQKGEEKNNCMDISNDKLGKF